MGWRAWTRERLTAALMQTYLQDQVVQHYASRAQRLAEGPAVPTAGMVSWLEDEQALEVFTAGAWTIPGALGLVASSVAGSMPATVDVGTTATRYTGLSTSLTLYPGRIYEARLDCGLVAAVADTQHEASVRIAKAPTVPVAADPMVSGIRAVIGGLSDPWGWYGDTTAVPFAVTTLAEYNLAPFYRRSGGTGGTRLMVNMATGYMRLKVYDAGSLTRRASQQLTAEEALLTLPA